WHTSLGTYRAMEIVAGLACAAVVLAGRRRGWDQRQSADACLALGLIWMTLCGPATESSTYVLLAPVLARAVFEVSTKPRPRQVGQLLAHRRVVAELHAEAGRAARRPAQVGRVAEQVGQRDLGLDHRAALVVDHFHDDPAPAVDVAGDGALVRLRRDHHDV